MNRTLSWLNFAGVAVLAALCVWQWRANRDLHLTNAALVRSQAEQAGRIDELERQRRGLTADLENFRGQLERTLAELRTSDGKLAAAEQTSAQLAVQVDQLKQSVAAWSAAVTARDERLTEANDRIRDTGARLEDSVHKYNELAQRYNGAIRDYEALGQRYQEVVAQLNAARGTTTEPRPEASR